MLLFIACQIETDKTNVREDIKILLLKVLGTFLYNCI